ncbi:MAG: geranylgeranylglycerol-phosphate geranylgeranyltransferase, partial [Candidatus Thermoplasmatota archaeon]|nr:geranylgeranylglycerol-phosphate geranylgeranyltransferase [Candidatus Thermoplasmatota archaeon]
SLGAYIALMRPKNLVLAGATVPLGAYFALMDAADTFPVLAVALHTLAVVLFTGAGNAMNDIKDAEIDKTAHPMRPIPSGQLSIQQASRFTSLLWTLSVAGHIGGLLAVEPTVSTYLPTVLIYILAVVLMVTYDHGPATKNRGLSGNIVISLLVGAVILYGASAVGGFAQPVIWWIFGVVFLTNLAREMVKDCMDMEADEGSRQTLPMTYGKEKVRMAAYVVIMGALVCLYVPFWKGPFQFGQIALQIPAILTLITLNGPMVQGKDALVAGRIRMAMLLGLVSFIVASVL